MRCIKIIDYQSNFDFECLNKLLRDPPNLTDIEIDPYNGPMNSIKRMKKIGSNVRNLTLNDFWRRINDTYKPFMNSLKNQFILSKINSIEININKIGGTAQELVNECGQIIIDALNWSKSVKMNVTLKGFPIYFQNFLNSKSTKHLQFNMKEETKNSLVLTKMSEKIQLCQL